MKYIINIDFSYDIFDDGDVIATNRCNLKNYFLNKTTWFTINLFSKPNTFDKAQITFIQNYKAEKELLIKEFKRIFELLLKNDFIKEV